MCFEWLTFNLNISVTQMKVFNGMTIIQASDEEIGELEVITNATLGVDNNGVILFVKVDGKLVSGEETKQNDTETEFINCEGENEFWCPGLIDLHYHAPQEVFAGTATDRPLMEWLGKYAFPAETRMADASNAQKDYPRVVKNSLISGTTTGVYFATIHVESSCVMGSLCQKYGQRAYIGKISMDRNSPDDYTENTNTACDNSRLYLKKMSEMGLIGPDSLVCPIICPRFVPTCTDALLRELSSIRDEFESRSKTPILVTTHVAESIDEVRFCEQLADTHDGEARDCIVLHNTGLLKNSIMAHAVHLHDDELLLMKKVNSGIAHCPLSNCYFAHGQLRVKRAVDLGVAVGLGTDVSGGYDCGMLSAIRHTVTSSLCLNYGVSNWVDEPPKSPACEHIPQTSSDIVTYKLAFYLATLGGATVLHQSHRLGTLTAGKQFDALRINPMATSKIHVSETDTRLDIFQKWVHLGDDRHIKSVYVAGRCVAQNGKTTTLE